MNGDEKPWNERVRESLVSFTKILRQEARKVADNPDATDKDRTALKEDVKQLADAVEALIKINIAYDHMLGSFDWENVPKELCNKLRDLGPLETGGLTFLSMALHAAVRLGNYLLVLNPITERATERIEREARKSQTYKGLRARETQKQKWQHLAPQIANGILDTKPELRDPGMQGKLAAEVAAYLRDDPTMKIDRSPGTVEKFLRDSGFWKKRITEQ